jgi:hypothetical protein
LFSPLSALRVNQEAARAGTTLRGQPIDLARESFSIYVPAHPYPPLHGYSLLVFVPPWSRAEVPSQWIPRARVSATKYVPSRMSIVSTPKAPWSAASTCARV